LDKDVLMALLILRRGTFVVLILLGVFLAVPASGARVKVWHHHAPAHFDRATFKDTVVSSEGALQLARELKPLANLHAVHVWDVVEDKHGNLFVATGDEGKIYKITPEGKTTVAYKSADTQVFCLAVGPDGAIYAGTGPGGTVICLPPTGKAKVIEENLDNYVWSLAVDPESKTIYAGTGPKGRIFQMTPEGKACVFYSTKQDHILCLARGPDGLLYAGTDKGGLVYRIDAKGKGFVLYSAAQSEVRSLLVTADGLYAGTSAPVKRKSFSGSSGGTGYSPLNPPSGAAPASLKESKDKGDAVKEATGDSSSGSSDSGEEPKKNAAPAPAPPATGENSLYRISPDGTVRELFREKAMLLSLAQQNGRVLVGTGMQGQLFEIDEKTKEKSEIARLDHGQIHCLCKRKDGSIVLGTGDPGKLYVLQDKYAAKGTVISEVLDAKIISKWGALAWKQETPAGTKVSIAVRAGNTAEPDETWSDWSTEQSDPQSGKIAAPTARYLQYRVTLTTDNAKVSPSVRGLTLRYMTTNQAPEITSLEVPDLDAVNLENPKKLKLKWTAVDPNEDELVYALYVRKEGWQNWVKLADDLEKTTFEWDTTTTPAGIYQVKVVASDRKDNPPEDALTCEKISAAFPVAHSPPAVTVTFAGMEGEHAVIEATATDPLVRLTEASFAVNGKKWANVFPKDGLFDSKREDFRFKTEGLKPGTYVVVLRVRDAAGNVGSGDVVFTVEGKKTGK
jgi:outer membrane protein assembly factor BamB